MNRLSSLRSVQELLDSPWLVLIARNGVRVRKWCTAEDVLCTFAVVLMRVVLWVMMHQPLPDHLTHSLRVLGDGIPVSVMEQLAVLESRLLGA